MNLPHAFLRRFSWLNFPGALLLTLLQRTPVVKVAATAGESLAAPAWGAVMRAAGVTLASLGGVHTLAGATEWSFSRPSPVSAVSGSVFQPLAFTIRGAQTPPGSFLVTGLPPGLAVGGANSAGVLNASTGVISGTPTTPGTYTVNITAWEFANRGGDFIGPQPFTIVVTAGLAVLPTFQQQPASQTVTVGSTVTLSASATGIPAPSYQWRRNNAAISGATASSYTLGNVQAADTADFTVVASNSAGSVVSEVATLTVTSVEDFPRLANLSVRTTLPAAQILTVGVTMQGGAKPVLFRAVGPGLSQFGLSGVMTDPKLSLFVPGAPAPLATNDNWGGGAALSTAFTAVGAFGLPAASLDAALLQSIDGGRTAQITGTGAGTVLVEAYDAGSGGSPRLINVSARNRVGTGDSILIAGFNVSGVGTKNLLIRAVGPSLAAFGIGGFLVDPKLEVYTASPTALVGSNDTWSPSLASTFASVGAFALTAGSKDAALVIRLQPGSYTVQVSGADGGTGEAIVEIYELP